MNKDDSLNGNCIGGYYKLYVFCCTCLPSALLNLRPPVAPCCLFYVVTSRSAQFTPSGGSIFRCTTKDRGERRAKGLQSRPLNSGFLYGGMRGDVRTFLRVRIGAIDAIKSAAALRLFPCLSVLHVLRIRGWHLWNNQRFANLAVWWLQMCLQFSEVRVRTGSQ